MYASTLLPVNPTYNKRAVVIVTLIAALMSLNACDPSERLIDPDSTEPSCMEMSPSPSEVCQREGLTLASDSQCAVAPCQNITYETSCSGSRETSCLIPDELCAEEPPEPSSICAAEGQVLATEADCAEMECQAVSYPSACGQLGRTLCRAPDPSEPLPADCVDRDEEQCGEDGACRWLIPEPWACAEPEEILQSAGCFPMMNCREDADCGEGEQCQQVAFGECDQPGDVCEACASYESLCLPAD